MIPEGEYTARANQWDFGETEKDGKPFVAVQCEITEGEHAGACLTYYGYFTEKTEQRTIESLRYMGWKGDDIMDMQGMGDILFRMVVGYEEYEGKQRVKVKWINRLGGGGPIKLEKPMSMQQKRMFAAKMKMVARQIPAVAGGYPARRPDTEVPDGSKKDDIPF